MDLGSVGVSTVNVEPARAGADAPLGDSGLAALVLFAAHFRIPVQLAQLRHELALGTSLAGTEDLTRAAKRLKFRARLLKKQNLAQLAKMPTPAIVEMGTQNFAIF